MSLWVCPGCGYLTAPEPGHCPRCQIPLAYATIVGGAHFGGLEGELDANTRADNTLSLEHKGEAAPSDFDALLEHHQVTERAHRQDRADLAALRSALTRLVEHWRAEANITVLAGGTGRVPGQEPDWNRGYRCSLDRAAYQLAALLGEDRPR